MLLPGLGRMSPAVLMSRLSQLVLFSAHAQCLLPAKLLPGLCNMSPVLMTRLSEPILFLRMRSAIYLLLLTGLCRMSPAVLMSGLSQLVLFSAHAQCHLPAMLLPGLCNMSPVLMSRLSEPLIFLRMRNAYYKLRCSLDYAV
jgi:hypothetical protein